jgi:RNA polymerase sigma-70 factor (ECF subfamily)
MLLAQLLVDSPSVVTSDTLALLSLMCFSAARLESRVDDEGRLVPLDQQDRARWDRTMIRRGFACLARSAEMDAVTATRYHLEAAIASRHCSASSFEQTDWTSICHLYDRLLDVDASPMVALNRAVALSYRDGAAAAIPLVEAIQRAGALPHTHVVVAVLANLHTRAGSSERARPFLDAALARAKTPHERELIARQIDRVSSARDG